MNIHLHKVINDITGVTGLAIIRGIVAGQHDPIELAKLRHYSIRASEETIAKALTGDYREEHLFCLKQELAMYEFTQQQLRECEAKINELWRSFDAVANAEDAPPPKSRAKETPERIELFKATGVDLTAIDGLNVQTVKKILAETGYEMTRWPSEKHFASWLSLAPNNAITGGAIKKSKTLAKNRAAEAFRIAAWTLSNSKSALGAYYRRMRSRKGAKHAVTATAHKLARLFYRMLRYGQQYVDKGVDYYERRYKDRIAKNAIKRLRSLGYEITESQGKQVVVGAVS